MQEISGMLSLDAASLRQLFERGGGQVGMIWYCLVAYCPYLERVCRSFAEFWDGRGWNSSIYRSRLEDPKVSHRTSSFRSAR